MKNPLAYALAAAGAALVGYALIKPDEDEGEGERSLLPETSAGEDLVSGAVSGGAAGLLQDQRQVTGYERGLPFEMTVAAIGNGQYLRVDAAHAFVQMAAAALRDGVSIRAGSAFRSMLSQTGLYVEYVARFFLPPTVAKPGTSNHQNGTAVDVAGANGRSLAYGTVEFDWLMQNAINYGWSWDEGRKVNEPWHWRYVG